MSTTYRPLPVVTHRPKTRCSECMHEFSWPGEDVRRHSMCGLVFGFDLFRDKDCPPGLPPREQADAGLCDYFKPTLRTRLAWWLGWRERETLTLVNGEVVSGIAGERDEADLVAHGEARRGRLELLLSDDYNDDDDNDTLWIVGSNPWDAPNDPLSWN